ncbi:copper chaperone PCu(A)C [Brevundimonas sp. NPDC092305]|uniref:copper chaperone PCu(A)C n=1 Tax=Brevundimonas sp. NPDC092305 TaxID=3363957 RepID=UPI0037F5B886
MKRLLSLAAFALVTACSAGGTAAPARVDVADAICRPAAPGRDVTGCYVTLTASRNDRLVSAASPSARALQIHEMKSADGMMQMSELPDGLPLPAGEAVHLAPGGNHIMLLGATGSLATGGTIPVTLTFEHAPAQQVTFRIAQPATAEHSGH